MAIPIQLLCTFLNKAMWTFHGCFFKFYLKAEKNAEVVLSMNHYHGVTHVEQIITERQLPTFTQYRQKLTLPPTSLPTTGNLSTRMGAGVEWGGVTHMSQYNSLHRGSHEVMNVFHHRLISWVVMFASP